MRITKVKYKNDKVEIHYLKPSMADPDQYDEYTMKCTDKPLQTFIDAFHLLVPAVLEICEFSGEDAQNYKVFGVSFAYTEDIMGAVISAQKTLVDSNTPLNLNTPFKPSESYSGEGCDDNCLSSASRKVLESLIEEAIKYVNGDRAQLNLFAKKVA